MRKRYRSKKYLNWIKTKDCLVGGDGEVQYHHCRTGFICGTGIKPDDYLCIPLSTSAHHEIHQIGETPFFEKHGINPRMVIVNNIFEVLHQMGHIEFSFVLDDDSVIEKFFNCDYENMVSLINLTMGDKR